MEGREAEEARKGLKCSAAVQPVLESSQGAHCHYAQPQPQPRSKRQQPVYYYAHGSSSRNCRSCRRAELVEVAEVAAETKENSSTKKYCYAYSYCHCFSPRLQDDCNGLPRVPSASPSSAVPSASLCRGSSGKVCLILAADLSSCVTLDLCAAVCGRLQSTRCLYSHCPYLLLFW